MSSHRSRTKRKTLTWQGAGVLLAAGAVGLFILPIADWIRPAQANWDGVGARPVALTDGGADSLGMSLAEAQSMGDILLALAPPKIEPPEPPPEEIKDKPEETTTDGGVATSGPHPAPPSGSVNWIYLGSAITPRASRALVRIDQSQKFVREGTEVDGVKLLEVHNDHIVVEKAGMQKQIERAPMIASAMLAPPKEAAGASRAGAPTPPVPTPPAGSAAAALAAAQAAHGKAPKGGGPTPPGRLVARVMQLSPEIRAQAFTAMTSATATYEERIKAISELGFDPEASLVERQEAMRAIGVIADTPEVMRILEDEMNGAARKER